MKPRAWIPAAVVVVLMGAGCSSSETSRPGAASAAEAAGDREREARDAAGTDAVAVAVDEAHTDLESGLGGAALDALNQLVHEQPTSAQAWLALAQAHHDPDLPVELRDAETSVRAARQAMACLAGPPTATYLITLGTALYLDGQTDEALDAYRRALTDAGDDRAALQRLILELR